MLKLLFDAWIVSKTQTEALAEARRNSWSVSSRSKPNQDFESISWIDMEVFQVVLILVGVWRNLNRRDGLIVYDSDDILGWCDSLGHHINLYLDILQVLLFSK